MLSAKIHKNSILPNICIKPEWMNILEKSVKYDEGPAGWKIRKGVAPNSLKNALSCGPKDNS